MIRNSIDLKTSIVASEDGKKTYEIERKWNEDGKIGLVIELYPTISNERLYAMDSSTLHLTNHIQDFNWAGVKIVNLYSSVFSGKPSTSVLNYDVENEAYIEDLFDKENIADMDIVIAWGSSLASHKNTIEAKIEILTMLKERNLEGNVKRIVAGVDVENTPYHPLWLGLHYSSEQWYLEKFDVDLAIEELQSLLQEKNLKITDKKIKAKKKSGKVKENKDVLENSESTGCEVLEEGAKAV